MTKGTPQCEVITLVGYRRCRKPGNRVTTCDGRERRVCTMHDEWVASDSNVYYDSPRYLSSPGYRARLRYSQTSPGRVTLTTRGAA